MHTLAKSFTYTVLTLYGVILIIRFLDKLNEKRQTWLRLNITRTKHDDTQEIKVINRVGFNKLENLLLDKHIRANTNATAEGRFVEDGSAHERDGTAVLLSVKYTLEGAKC